MKSQGPIATTVLSPYRAPAPRKVSKIVDNNSKDWFGTSQAPVFTTIGLGQNSEADSSLQKSEEDCSDRRRLSITESSFPSDEDSHELSYTSQGNALVDLESFYPLVLNFESGEIVAANGSIHTIKRTTTCESGIVQSSVSVAKSKEPTIFVVRNCLNSKTEDRHHGSCKHDSHNALDVEYFNRSAVNLKSSIHSFDTVVTGDTDSSGSPVRIKRTLLSPSLSPFEVLTTNSIERGINSNRRTGRSDEDVNSLQEVLESADTARESVGVPAGQTCCPTPGPTSMKLSSKGIEESKLNSGTEGYERSVVQENYKEQLKESKNNQQQRKNDFPPSEGFDRVHGTLHSAFSVEKTSYSSFMGASKTRSKLSEREGGGGGGGGEERMKSSSDLSNRNCDLMHLTSTVNRSISDSPFGLPSWTPGCCEDESLCTSYLDRTTLEIVRNEQIEKLNSLHVDPHTLTHTHSHTPTHTNSRKYSPSDIRVTIQTLLSAVARQKLSPSPVVAANPIRNQKNIVTRVAVSSYLSFPFPFPSSFSPHATTATATEVLKQSMKASILLLFYTSILISLCIMFGQNETFSSHPSLASTSPWVGQFNASDVISDRLFDIEDLYLSLLHRTDWQLSHSYPCATAETLSTPSSSKSKRTHYVKVCAVLEAPPSLVLSLLQWDGGALRETLQEADEYHGTIQLLFSVSDAVNVFMKTTKRLLLFPKREMTGAVVDKTTTERLTISNIKVGISTVTPLSSLSLSSTHFSVRPLPCSTSYLSSVPSLWPSFFHSTGYKDCTFIPIKTITIPIGTSVRAVVNVNINLQYLPYTASQGLTQVLSESLVECDKAVAAYTGYSILEGVEYFYRYYYSSSSSDIDIDIDIDQSENDSESDSPDSSSSSSGSSSSRNNDRKENREGEVDSSAPKEVEKEEEEEEGEEEGEEIFEKAFHEEVSWFVPLRRGRTLLVTVLQVDLGSDIPGWAAEAGVASNAISKVLALQKIVKRKVEKERERE